MACALKTLAMQLLAVGAFADYCDHMFGADEAKCTEAVQQCRWINEGGISRCAEIPMLNDECYKFAGVSKALCRATPQDVCKWLEDGIDSKCAQRIFSEDQRRFEGLSRQLSSSTSNRNMCDASGCPLSIVILAGGISGCIALLLCFWRLMGKDWSTVKLASKGTEGQPLPLRSRPKATTDRPEPVAQPPHTSKIPARSAENAGTEQVEGRFVC